MIVTLYVFFVLYQVTLYFLRVIYLTVVFLATLGFAYEGFKTAFMYDSVSRGLGIIWKYLVALIGLILMDYLCWILVGVPLHSWTGGGLQGMTLGLDPQFTGFFALLDQLLDRFYGWTLLLMDVMNIGFFAYAAFGWLFIIFASEKLGNVKALFVAFLYLLISLIVTLWVRGNFETVYAIIMTFFHFFMNFNYP